MNKTSFKFKFKPVIYVLLIIVAACTLFPLVISALKISGVMATNSLFMDWATLVLSIILFGFLVYLFIASKYVFADKSLILQFGIIRQVIGYKDILSLKKAKDNTLWLIFVRADKSYGHMLINIEQEKQDLFTGQIRLHNPNVIYEIMKDESAE